MEPVGDGGFFPEGTDSQVLIVQSCGLLQKMTFFFFPFELLLCFCPVIKLKANDGRICFACK